MFKYKESVSYGSDMEYKNYHKHYHNIRSFSPFLFFKFKFVLVHLPFTIELEWTQPFIIKQTF